MEARHTAISQRRQTDISIESATVRRHKSFKPASLQWPFLVAYMAFFAAAIPAVLLMQRAMPNSDNSAYVDGQPMVKLARGVDSSDWDEPHLAKRQVIGGGGFRPGQVPKAPAPAPALVESVGSGTVGEESGATATAPGSSLETPDFVIKGGGFRPGLPIAISAAATALHKTDDRPDNFAGINLVVTDADIFSDVLVGVIKGGGGRPGVQTVAAPVISTTITFGTVKTAGGGFRPPSIPKVTPPPVAAVLPFQGGRDDLTTKFGALGIPPDVSSEMTFPSGNRTSITVQVTRWESDYVELGVGPTTVTKPLRGPALLAADGLISTAHPALETHTFVTTLPGILKTMVVTPLPETVVSTVDATLITVLVAQPAKTLVSTIDGVLSTLVSIPSPMTVISNVESSVTTAVRTKPPQTVVSAANGVPLTMVAVITPGQPLLETLVSVIRGSATTVTPPSVTYTTNIGGRLVTLTSLPAPYATTTGGTTTTITRIAAKPQAITTTIEATINGKPTSVTLTLNPTPTTNFGSPSNRDDGPQDNSTTSVFPGLTHAQYFAGAFLPTLIAVLLALPTTLIDLNAKLFQPFHALAQPGGASGRDSMTLRFGGIHAITTPIRLLRQGQAVPFVTTLLLWLSWLLAPLSAEAIGIKVHGVCSHLSISGCAIAIGVSPEPAFALVAVMAVMLALLLVLLALLSNWDTGVPYNPWSLAGIALLARDRRLREPLLQLYNPTEAELDAVFCSAHFRLGTLPLSLPFPVTADEKPHLAASPSPRIIPSWPAPSLPIPTTPTTPTTPTVTTTISSSSLPSQKPSRHQTPFRSLAPLSITSLAFFLLSLIALLTTYHLSPPLSPLELFFDSQTFGVKFLFAALGSTVSFFWAAFAQSLSAMSVFRRMNDTPQEAGRSVLVTRKTDALSAAWDALHQKEWAVFVVCSIAVLGEGLPVVLANVPYSLTQTRKTYDVCLGLSVGIMGGMVGLLVGVGMGMGMRKKECMPVDPRTVAGEVWYVADSAGLVEMVKKREWEGRRDRGREGRLRGLEGEYFYGRVVGSDGRKRMVVDVA